MVDMKKKGLAKFVKNIVLYDKPDQAVAAEAEQQNLKLITFSDVMKAGEQTPEKEMPFLESQPADVYIFSYTSGTTGDSKGVKLAHRNIIAAAIGVFENVALHADDVHISYLPYPHSFEQVVTAAMILVGGSIGYY